ncbi:shikimate kinase [Gammaproteobacteria bacterium]|nr:shikimate kinase [Gammaproteobacteria bacterium]
MKQELNTLPYWLQDKFIILVGLMGAGKTKLGRIIASSMNLPFIDTDAEIEEAAGYSIQEIFDRFGEAYFRDGERRVIKRLLGDQPAVLATGGGAYMDEQLRKIMSEHGIVIWLRADLDLLVKRTKHRSSRPLLNKGDTREILSGLMAKRYPVYVKSEIIIDVSEEPASKTATRIIDLLTNHNPEEDNQ